MNTKMRGRSVSRLAIVVALAAPMVALVGAGSASAQTETLPSVSGNTSDELRNRAPAVGEVVVTANRQNEAAVVSPTQNTLTATEPRSIIGANYIQNDVTPVSDFAGIIEIAPSVSLNSPAGIGIGESKNLQIRGFQDGQFNVEYDSIPFGDSNDGSHHSNSYFPASNIGEVSIDRGPGTAGTIGTATFGGTIGLFSPSVYPSSYVKADLSLGSFDTTLYGVQADTGPIKALADTNVLVNLQKLDSGGAVSHSPSQQRNALIKTETPIGSHTVLTMLSSLTFLNYDTPSGITALQTEEYGKGYGLSNNPGQFNYDKWNRQKHSTDFEYIGLNSDFGALHIDNKLYTYAYRNTGPSGADLTNLTAVGLKGLGASDVYGTSKLNAYRTLGDTLHIDYELSWATFRTGMWAQEELSDRYQYNIDYTQNVSYCTPAQNGSTTKTNTVGLCENYAMRYNDTTLQPFFDVDIRPFKGLTITPGVKYTSLTRDLKEAVDTNTLKPYDNTQTFTSTLPFLTARYEFSQIASVYAQYAKGFQAPPITVVYSGLENAASLKPQTTTNYQAGGVVRLNKLLLDADVYYIDFNNFIQATPDTATGDTSYANAGGVVYKGLEGEATYQVGWGFVVFGNGSLNSAKYDSSTLTNANQWVSYTPDSTAALGLIYSNGPWRGSVIAKYIGDSYRNSATKNATTGVALAEGYKVGGYATANLTGSYTFHLLDSVTKGSKIQFGIQNLFNDTSIVDWKGAKTASSALYTYDVGRNAYVSLEAAF
jgi:iron complex outermembrane receptor protein